MDANSLPPPPAVFATTERPYDPKDPFDSSESDVNDELMPQSEYQDARTAFLRDSRVKAVDKFIFTKMHEIKDIIKNGNERDIIELMQKRHRCKRRVMQTVTDEQQICEHNTCFRTAVPGSRFCVAHILNDRDQKLFTECPTCHRPYPVFGDCFLCREESL